MERSGDIEHLCIPPILPPVREPLVMPVDKPRGWSSFDVVRRMRSLLGVRKIGHAGTLDPMATGLLICMTGQATRRSEWFMSLPKEYVGTLRLGQTTASFDAETPIEEQRPWIGISTPLVEAAASGFVGEIEQRTPVYSAVKVGGERLYRKARRGERPVLPSRHVTVHAFEIMDRTGADVRFRVHCSKGTYVRVLAHDLGQALGCGAHLVALRRIAIGSIRVEDAWTMDAVAEAVGARSVGEA